MDFPDCLYQKAFWVVIPVLVALIGIIYGSVETSIAEVGDNVKDLSLDVKNNSLQLAENNVPTLKHDLKVIDEKLDSLLINSARIEQKINHLYP